MKSRRHQLTSVPEVLAHLRSSVLGTPRVSLRRRESVVPTSDTSDDLYLPFQGPCCRGPLVSPTSPRKGFFFQYVTFGFHIQTVFTYDVR